MLRHSSLKAATEGGITIVLDTTVSDELAMEGLAREIINKINTQRKNDGFEVTERISICMEATPLVRKCFTRYESYIVGEVLATEICFEKGGGGTEWDLNGERVEILLKRA